MTMKVYIHRNRLLPVKYTIISTCLVMSGGLGLAFLILTDSGLATAIDALINMCGLMLMTRYWRKSYFRICRPLLACLRCCFDEQTKYNIEMLAAYYGMNSTGQNLTQHLVNNVSNSSENYHKKKESRPPSYGTMN